MPLHFLRKLLVTNSNRDKNKKANTSITNHRLPRKKYMPGMGENQKRPLRTRANMGLQVFHLETFSQYGRGGWNCRRTDSWIGVNLVTAQKVAGQEFFEPIYAGSKANQSAMLMETVDTSPDERAVGEAELVDIESVLVRTQLEPEELFLQQHRPDWY